LTVRDVPEASSSVGRDVVIELNRRDPAYPAQRG
jgi:hypothetical protein